MKPVMSELMTEDLANNENLISYLSQTAKGKMIVQTCLFDGNRYNVLRKECASMTMKPVVSIGNQDFKSIRERERKLLGIVRKCLFEYAGVFWRIKYGDC